MKSMEEDTRTEAAIAAAACPEANVVPKTSKVTPAQLSKFQVSIRFGFPFICFTLP